MGFRLRKSINLGGGDFVSILVNLVSDIVGESKEYDIQKLQVEKREQLIPFQDQDCLMLRKKIKESKQLKDKK